MEFLVVIYLGYMLNQFVRLSSGYLIYSAEMQMQ